MIFEKNESPKRALTKFKLNKPTNPQLIAPTIIKNKQTFKNVRFTIKPPFIHSMSIFKSFMHPCINF